MTIHSGSAGDALSVVAIKLLESEILEQERVCCSRSSLRGTETKQERHFLGNEVDRGNPHSLRQTSGQGRQKQFRLRSSRKRLR